MTRQTTSRHDSSRSGESCRADEPRLPTLAQPTQTHIATGIEPTKNKQTYIHSYGPTQSKVSLNVCPIGFDAKQI